MKIRLKKVHDRTVEVFGTDLVTRQAPEYMVIVGNGLTERVAGYVRREWGVDYPGERAKVVGYWAQTDAVGRPVGVLGWSDYRKDAIDAVVRNVK